MVPQRPFFFVYETASAPTSCQAEVGEKVDNMCCSLTAGATISQYQLPYDDIFDGSADSCGGVFHVYGGPRENGGFAVASRLVDPGEGTFSYHEGCLQSSGEKDCNSCALEVVNSVPYGCYAANSFPNQTWLVMVGVPLSVPLLMPMSPSALKGMTCGSVKNLYRENACCGKASKLLTGV